MMDLQKATAPSPGGTLNTIAPSTTPLATPATSSPTRGLATTRSLTHEASHVPTSAMCAIVPATSTCDSSVHPTNGTCQLFRIPGELRNRIYEYALTEPDGLIYREDEKGMGRLCFATDVGAGPKGKTHLQRQKRSEVSGHPDQEQRLGKRQKISKEKWAPLEGNKDGTTSTTLIEANQLRFANKQLSQETRGLGIRYNDIIFRSDSQSTNGATEQSQNFISSCPASHKQHIRVLNIQIELKKYDRTEPRTGSLHGVLPKFGREYPKSRLMFCSSTFDQSMIMLPLIALCHRKAGKPDADHDHDIKILASGSAMAEDVLRMTFSELKIDEDVLPSNYRFFPLDRQFRAEEYRTTFRNHKTMKTLFGDKLEEVLEIWLSIVREIYEKGF